MFKKALLTLTLLLASASPSYATGVWKDDKTGQTVNELNVKYGNLTRNYCTWTSADSTTVCPMLLIGSCSEMAYRFDPDTTSTGGASRVYAWFCSTSTFSTNTCTKVIDVLLDGTTDATYIWDVVPAEKYTYIQATVGASGSEVGRVSITCMPY